MFSPPGKRFLAGVNIARHAHLAPRRSFVVPTEPRGIISGAVGGAESEGKVTARAVGRVKGLRERSARPAVSPSLRPPVRRRHVTSTRHRADGGGKPGTSLRPATARSRHLLTTLGDTQGRRWRCYRRAARAARTPLRSRGPLRLALHTPRTRAPHTSTLRTHTYARRTTSRTRVPSVHCRRRRRTLCKWSASVRAEQTTRRQTARHPRTPTTLPKGK